MGSLSPPVTRVRSKSRPARLGIEVEEDKLWHLSEGRQHGVHWVWDRVGIV